MPIRAPRRLISFASLTLTTSALAAPPLYRITDLDTLGGSASLASAINDNGDIVGVSLIMGDLDIRGFLHSNGQMTPLPTLGGDTFANGINNARRIVGDSQTSPGGASHGFWSDGAGQPHDIGTLGGTTSFLFDINTAGDMVGQSDVVEPVLGDDLPRAILIRNGQTTQLGTFGGDYSAATAINNKAQVVGYAAFPPPPDPLQAVRNHGFLWENGQMRDLGTLQGDTHSEAYALNENGQVVGTSETALGPTHAFLWQNGTMIDLGHLERITTFAAGINDAGVIVGDGFVDDTTTHAWVYYDGAMHDLNDLVFNVEQGWLLTSAAAINNAGSIVGRGVINGEEHAFLATPIPEPAAATGIIAALTLVRRRRSEFCPANRLQ
jgi:probable HAF family extracellular repeat protein